MNILAIILSLLTPFTSAAQGWDKLDAAQVPAQFNQLVVKAITADGIKTVDTNEVITVKTAICTRYYLEIDGQWFVQTVNN